MLQDHQANQAKSRAAKREAGRQAAVERSAKYQRHSGSESPISTVSDLMPQAMQFNMLKLQSENISKMMSWLAPDDPRREVLIAQMFDVLSAQNHLKAAETNQVTPIKPVELANASGSSGTTKTITPVARVSSSSILSSGHDDEKSDSD